jgi:predicted ATPase
MARSPARDGAGQVALVSGEAGIGKSRLVREALAPAATRHALVLRAHCFEADRAVPYAPVIEAVRAVGGGGAP